VKFLLTDNDRNRNCTLEAEGVSFKENGNVDLKKHLWIENGMY
jgi:alkylated DNA nucleotide flippase Atl1